MSAFLILLSFVTTSHVPWSPTVHTVYPAFMTLATYPFIIRITKFPCWETSVWGFYRIEQAHAPGFGLHSLVVHPSQPWPCSYLSCEVVLSTGGHRTTDPTQHLQPGGMSKWEHCWWVCGSTGSWIGYVLAGRVNGILDSRHMVQSHGGKACLSHSRGQVIGFST